MKLIILGGAVLFACCSNVLAQYHIEVAPPIVVSPPIAVSPPVLSPPAGSFQGPMLVVPPPPPPVHEGPHVSCHNHTEPVCGYNSYSGRYECHDEMHTTCVPE